MDRGPEGYPVLKPPDGPAPPGERQAFLRRCYLLAITVERAAKLWAEQQAGREREKAAGKKPKPKPKPKGKGQRATAVD